MRLDAWISQAEARLAAGGIASSRMEAQVLAGHVLRVERPWLIAHPDHDFPELAGEPLLQRRLSSEPLAYILGWREFYGRRFAVRPGVLIPRQETETLVEAALELYGAKGSANVLDVGTGSGCLAATLKLEKPGWTVIAGDKSWEALDIATANFKDLGADVLPTLTDGTNAIVYQSLDLIVTNPPYVASDDELASEIRDWEPHDALFAGNHGLAFYEKLAIEASLVLKSSGLLLTELGAGQLERVTTIFEAGGWRTVKSWPDLSGIDRVLAIAPG